MTRITRFSFSPRTRQAVRALASPQVLHAIVAHSTETADGTPRERVLWRLDPGAERHTLFIVSDQVPAGEVLAGELGGSIEQLLSLDYAPLLKRLTVGDEWRFRLKANPTRSVTTPGQKRGRRVGLVKGADQLQWLTDRAGQLGVRFPTNRFDLPEVMIQERQTREFERREDHVTLATAIYDGFLIVEDPELLRKALTGGIGRAKGYGYGLLTLAPMRAEG
ncbi:type I-E CRISPR-associated protein Cas6/Cse3/CasE [Pseudoclavibacter sp. 13-3]|uniref:type I-E CRISPR-associated protein Cas6/Cse3/CasE n=1 Tax=Pseudoclavibacter sp. 13-3 TaxID=2901228 RepID=UPI001E564A1A|nr:type I-E CRISPR-associated protein Cas6/Cse3/CasE [Pseudoclavibacter sp. 13-3]MCD7100739.1 type I-E CRISPR-associated protein Cas6/Cse3/CasE [Pseudoclavibacter sp. 13-3]